MKATQFTFQYKKTHTQFMYSFYVFGDRFINESADKALR